MAKQLNVDLNFRANTAQAQQSIQQLQSSLTQIAAAGSLGIGGEKITTEMKQAGQAAKELQMHLTKAFNVNTGKLDLNKLNNSLLSSKTSLSSLSKDLMAIGPSGTQAFTQLATSISQANAPMITLNSLFSNLWITMKNTAKWQLTSSMIHGFVGSVQEAYHYAQDLNKSLNNIRIVTGLSVEEMDKFAEKANKAAKALSASTLDYTEAALIYYQQGLSGKEVEERANTTVKMANVTRQNAEEVSDQLTAIWNNFYDGSQSLESFADKMVALGAATASSSDEIAGGLEKFAAVGETIGLSFDYAAAALATITSNTRQSEEVVGTALKTIFARIQGLKLGETLEDGVELNKYSQALETIGVNIFDTNGQLKNMDQILDETAAKWEGLTKAQQTATAQTVAGIRQYNQFIALMDNWNNGDNDSMMANLQTANNASGALQEQADIYAESWEAARDRVTASAEAIYQALLDDDFFIGLANMWGDALGGIKEFIDGIGGLKGVFGIAITFITSALASRLGPAIDNIRANFQVMFSSASAQANKLATEMHDMIGVAQQQTGIDASKSQQVQLDNANNLIVAKTKLVSVNKNLSSHERMLAEMNISLIESEQQKALSIAETIDKLKEESAVLKEIMGSDSTVAGMAERMMSPVDRRFGQLEDQKMQAVASGDRAQITETNNALMALNSQYENIMFSANAAAKAISTEFVAGLEKGGNEIVEGNVVLKEYIASLTEFANKNVSHMTTPESLSNARMIVTEYASTLPDAVTKTEDFQKALSALGRVGINGGANSAEQMKKAILNLVQAMGDAKFNTADLRKMMIQLGQGTNVKKFEADIQNLNKKERELLETQQRLNKAVESFNPTHKFGKIEKITAFGSALMSVSMIYNSLKSAVASWTDPDISFGEKLMTSFMSIGMILPMLSSGFNNMLKMMGLMNIEQSKQITQSFAVVAARAVEVQSLDALGNAKLRETVLNQIRAGQTDEEIIQSMMAANADLTEAEAKAVLNGVKAKETALTKLQTAADNGNLVAKAALFLLDKAGITIEAGGLVVREGSIAATIAQTVANWGLNASMTPLIIIIGLLIASLAGLVLIIWGVVSAIKAITDAYNADAIAAQEAAKYADLMAEKYNKLTEEANKFKEAVSGYEEAINSLKGLEKGTNEYKEALEQANEKAMELIETYGLWDDFTRDGDLITFKSGVLENMQSEKDQKASLAKNENYAAKIINNQASNKSQETNLQRDIGNKVKYTYETRESTATGYRQFSDSEIQELITAINSSGFDFANSSPEFLTEWLKNPIDENGEALNKFSSAITDNIDAIVQNKNQILSYANSVQTAENANKVYAEEILKNVLTDEVEEKQAIMSAANGNQEIYDQIVNAKTTRFAEDIKVNEKTLEQTIADINVSGVKSNNDLEKNSNGKYTDMNDEKTARAYARDILGYTQEEVDAMVYKSGSGKGTLTDASGTNKIVDEVNDETMRAALARTAQIEAITADFDKQADIDSKLFDKVMGNLVDSGELGQGIIASLQNGIENADFSQLYGSIESEEERKALTDLNTEELMVKLGLDPNSNDFNEQIKALGYNSAEEFEKAFDEGLAGWSPEAFKEQQEAKANSLIENAAAQYELDPEVLKVQAKLIQQNTEGLEDNAVAAAEMAVANQRMNKGVDKLTDSWKDWKKTLKGTDKTTQDYAEALVGAQDAMKDILNLSEDTVIPEDFLQAPENLDLLDEIANGSEEAVEKLGFNLTKAQITATEMSSDIRENLINMMNLEGTEGTVSVEQLTEKFNTIRDNAITAINGIQEAFNGLQPGATLTGEKAQNFANALNDYAMMTGMSVEQMQSMLNQMQVHAEVTTTEKEIESKVPKVEKTRSISEQTYDDEGNLTGYKWTESARTIGFEPTTEYIQVAQINTDEPVTFKKINAGTIAPSVTTGGKNSGGGGGGGGGSNPKPKKPTKAKTVEKTEPKKKDDEIERYKEITEEIDDLNRELDRLGGLKDDAWGPDKIAAMDAEINKYKQLITSTKKYASEIGKLDKDGNAISGKLKDDQDAVKKLGATFDEFGRLTNYDELMGKLVDDWNSTQASLDTREQAYEDSVAAVANTEYAEGQEQQQWDAEDANEATKKAIDDERENADKAFEEGKKVIEQYMETLNLSEETQAQIEDYMRSVRDLNYEKIMYEVEYKIDIDDSALKILETELELLGDDFYKSVEKTVILGQKLGIYIDTNSDSTDPLQYSSRFALVSGKRDELDTQLANGDISQEQWREGYDRLIDQGVNDVSAINEYDEFMKGYYEDTLDSGLDEIASYTQGFDTMLSTLDHYRNTLTLVTGEENYEAIGVLLESRMNVLEDSIQASEHTIRALNNSKDIIEKALKDPSLSAEAKENLEKDLKYVNDKIDEETAVLQGKFEEFYETNNEQLRNSISQSMKDYENALTNGMGFDAIATSMDRINTYQEDYLSNTNKMYETNKLINQVEKDIAKTTNLASKQKYNDYIKYIEKLQQAEELSELELSIAQGRYEVLQAQIALEEAQEAKNQVRLTRDAEGNYGYVYTANEDNVADAEQNLADKENALYNIGLEGTKNYSEKVLQIQQESVQAMDELMNAYYVDHSITQEQFLRGKAELEEYYGEQLASYQRQFNIAQYEMAVTSYDDLEANDTTYYGGLQTKLKETQKNLNDGMRIFNTDTLTKEESNYIERSKKDGEYFTGLQANYTVLEAKAKSVLTGDRDSVKAHADTMATEMGKSLDACETAADEWQKNVDTYASSVVTDLDSAKTKTGEVETASGLLAKKIAEEVIPKVQAEWTDVATATTTWEAHRLKIEGVKQAYLDLLKSMQAVLEEAGKKPASPPEPPKEEEPPKEPEPPKEQPKVEKPKTESAEEKKAKIKAEAIELLSRIHYAAGYNNKSHIPGDSWRENSETGAYKQDAIDLVSSALNNSLPGHGYKYDFNTAIKLINDFNNFGFATGGYTGEWGPEGKLAMLHEKELVLNKQDTENFLTATNMLREISQMLDNNALLASLGMINLSAMTIGTPADQILQQEVTIHADFPNVTDHNEIEIAIDNLINAASQHAYRI